MGSSSVRIVPARARVAPDAETRIVGDWMEVTLFAPDIPEGKFRYSVSKRYLLVWADTGRRGNHHFVILPRPADPEGHDVKFANGVVDARIRVGKA